VSPTKAKGIYKPKELAYAVSIRINLGSPYADGVPVPTSGGGWLLSYHQEGTDPAERDKQYTNRALIPDLCHV
jgi:putative restriction endonuclease